MKLKEMILNDLENNTDKNLNGQMLAEKYNVSRNAIWKCINQLKDEGHNIISDKRGYCIVENYNSINSNLIKKYLNNKDLDITVYDSVGSTNDEAKIAAANKSNDYLIVSSYQSKGRGRNGKSFVSFANKGIYMSLTLAVNSSFQDIIKITTYTALSICEALKKVANIDTQIKWVNDIYLNNKKVVGILTEAISDFESGVISHIIIGIGINLYHDSVPEELKDIIGFLDEKDINKNMLIAEIVNNLLKFNERKDCFIEDYKTHSLMIKKEITYIENNIPHKAISLDIDENGGLVIKDENNNIRTLRSGEISIRFK